MNWSPPCNDGTLPRDAYLWRPWIASAAPLVWRAMYVTKQRLADAGFVDIEEEAIRLPLGSWPTEPYGGYVGRWFNLGTGQSQPRINGSGSKWYDDMRAEQPAPSPKPLPSTETPIRTIAVALRASP